MKNFLITILVLISTLLCACSPYRVIDHDEDGGIIQNATVIPTNFNECQKMQIHTDKVVVIIFGSAIVPIGQRATIRTYTDEQQAILWPGNKCVHFIKSN